MIAATLASKVGLILSVLTCSGGDLPVADCPTERLAVYDVASWVGPTEADMLECLQRADTLIGNGERAKCEIVPADVITPASLDDYRAKPQALAF